MAYETMNRGRSQVIWRYAPHALFRYNESGGWCKTTEISLNDPKPLTGALAEAVKSTLTFWNAIGPTGFPDPEFQANRYSVGEPYQVWFSVWPLVFECRNCRMIHYYSEIPKLLSVNDKLFCMKCKQPDLLRQVPFAYVHECGQIETVFIPAGHPKHTIKLINKGSFQESYWFCEDCKQRLQKDSRAGLGFRACDCAPKKAKRGILLDDSRIYYSQNLALVDIEPQVLDKWKENSRFSDLLLAAVLRGTCYKPNHLLDLVKWKPAVAGLSPELKAMKELLIQSGMAEAQAEAAVQQAAKKAGADPWVDYDSALSAYRGGAGARDWKSLRRSVEYIFVRDEPSSAAISLDQLIQDANEIGDLASENRLNEQKTLAADLGLANLQIVEALPILLAGIGYSRYFPVPQAGGDGDQAKLVTLRPFPAQNGKIPIYAARNTTEALLYELDPWRLAAFISLNTKVPIPAGAAVSDSSIRFWLLSQCPLLVERGEAHFVLTSFEQEAGQSVEVNSALSFGVLHTLSHVLKATAHRYVGIDGDALSEYLFPAHSAGLLYVSTHVEFTLGGIDSVFRSNLLQWFGSARDYAGRCSFDPVCSSSGGACLACLYPKFGCTHFNRTVSRSFLFGGMISGRPEPIIGYWSLEVRQATEALLAKQL